MQLRRFLSTAGFLALASSAQATYSGYTYQRTITIDHTKVGTATLTYNDFPMLSSGTIPALATSSHAVTGYDIVWSTMSDCSYLLNWSTETYSSSTGQWVGWVRVPQISSATDTTVYMCYGNAGITTFQGNPTGTWTSNYLGVWHLNEAWTSSAVKDFKDATANHLDGTGKGATTTHPTQAAAQILYGQTVVNTSTQSIIVTSSSVMNVGTSSFTLSAWFYPTTQASASEYIIGRFTNNPSNEGYLLKRRQSDGFVGCQFFDNSSNTINAYDNVLLSLNVWHHCVCSVNRTSNLVSFYIDGALIGAPQSISALTASLDGAVNPVGFDFEIGGNYQANQGWADGTIDEARLIKSVLSEGWVKTEYNNQNSPSTFVTVGSESGGSVSNSSPTVSITSPSGGAVYTSPASITISATASDSDGTVATVGFYHDGVLISSDTTNPYSATWGSVSAGTYVLTARAQDDLGAYTISSGISVTVGDAIPPPAGSTSGGLNLRGGSLTIQGTKVSIQ